MIPANQLLWTFYGPMIVNRHAGEFDPLAKGGRSASHDAIEACIELIRCCGPEAHAIDVGACFGAFTLAFARCAEKVWSFEPQIWLYQCLMGSLALNELTNVEARQVAVGDRCGVATVPGLDYLSGHMAGSLPIAEFANARSYDDLGQVTDDRRAKRVQMIALDAIRGLRADFIKVDVEGMELAVLLGAEETIARNRPALYVEHLKGDRTELLKWFAAHDYVEYINGCDYIAFPKEKRGLFPVLNYEKDDAETAGYRERDQLELGRQVMSEDAEGLRRLADAGRWDVV